MIPVPKPEKVAKLVKEPEMWMETRKVEGFLL